MPGRFGHRQPGASGLRPPGTPPGTGTPGGAEPRAKAGARGGGVSLQPGERGRCRRARGLLLGQPAHGAGPGTVRGAERALHGRGPALRAGAALSGGDGGAGPLAGRLSPSSRRNGSPRVGGHARGTGFRASSGDDGSVAGASVGSPGQPPAPGGGGAPRHDGMALGRRGGGGHPVGARTIRTGGRFRGGGGGPHQRSGARRGASQGERPRGHGGFRHRHGGQGAGRGGSAGGGPTGLSAPRGHRGCPLRLLLAPDHYTPVQKRTHVDDPVPLLVVDGEGVNGISFTEPAAESAPLVSGGWEALAALYAGRDHPFR